MSDEKMTPEKFEELAKELSNVLGVAKGLEGLPSDVVEIKNELATFKGDHEKDVERMAEMTASVKATLAASMGRSGSEDFLMDTSKFIRGLYHKRMGYDIPADLTIGADKVADLLEGRKTDFTTTTAATAGYLLPDLLAPGIKELLDIYGNLYPEVTKVTVPAGSTLKLNKDAARPVASWRATQLGAITEDTAMEFGQDTLVSELLGSVTYIANEMFQNPSINFAAVASTRMLYAILVALETGLLAGTTPTTPNNGVIAGATDQGTAGAAITFDGLITFLTDCIADNRYASDPARNVIFLTPADALKLAAEQLGGTGTGMLVWGDSRLGIPTTFMGYRVIIHPDCDNATNKYALLGDPASITLSEGGAFAVDLSEHIKFVENGQALRVFNHYAWSVGQTVEWHKKIFT